MGIIWLVCHGKEDAALMGFMQRYHPTYPYNHVFTWLEDISNYSDNFPRYMMPDLVVWTGNMKHLVPLEEDGCVEKFSVGVTTVNVPEHFARHLPALQCKFHKAPSRPSLFSKLWLLVLIGWYGGA